MSMSLHGFICKFLDNLCEGREVPGSLDGTNFQRSILTRSGELAAAKYLNKRPGHACTEILGNFLKR